MAETPYAFRESPETCRAFIKGISVGLVFPAASWCFWAAGWTLFQVPRHEEIFKSLAVSLSPATLFLLKWYSGVAILLAATGVACIVGTSRFGERRAVAVLNVTAWVLAMAWQAFASVVLSSPVMSLLQGIGR